MVLGTQSNGFGTAHAHTLSHGTLLKLSPPVPVLHGDGGACWGCVPYRAGIPRRWSVECSPVVLAPLGGPCPLGVLGPWDIEAHTGIPFSLGIQVGAEPTMPPVARFSNGVAFASDPMLPSDVLFHFDARTSPGTNETSDPVTALEL